MVSEDFFVYGKMLVVTNGGLGKQGRYVYGKTLDVTAVGGAAW